MDISNPAERPLVGESSRARIKALLRVYPEISPDEVAEIRHFLKSGPILEVGLLGDENDARAGLERFRADHGDSSKLGFQDYLRATLMVVALVIACVLLWDMGVK